MIKKLTYLLVMLPLILLGQVPGGVSTPVVWYRADALVYSDAGTTNAANNATVQQWNDFLGTGRNLIQATSARRPVYSNSTMLANFNPTVTFTRGSSHWMQCDPGTGNEIINRASGTFYSAGYMNINFLGTSLGAGLIGFNEDMDNPGLHTSNNGLFNLMMYSENGFNFTPISTNSFAYKNSFVSGSSWENGVSTTNPAQYGATTISLNGTRTFYSGDNFRNVNLSNSWRTFRIGGDTDWGFHEGQLNEILIYQNILTPQEKSRLESYLAIKYGTTLSGDYVNSTNGVVWTTDLAYQHNIFGIARDDLGALHQKQSRSENDNQKLIIGNGNGLFNTNAANNNGLTDQQFLIVGDNGLKQSLHTPLVYTSGSNGETNFRFESIWKVQNSGSVGTVTVAWPKGINNLYIVQSPDAAFDGTDSFTPMTTEVTVNGVVYNTATVNLSNGQFFTFAGFELAPGGVTGTDFWVKSDDAGNIATAWKDHSANADDIPAVGTWTLSPADRAHNFHPYTTGYTSSINFYNNSSVLNPTNGLLTNVSHSIFSAVRPISAGTGRITGIDDTSTYASEPAFSIEDGELRFYKFSGGTNADQFEEEPFNIGAVNVVSGIGNNSTANGGTSTSAGGERVLGVNGIYKTYPNTSSSNSFHFNGQHLRIGYGQWSAPGAFPGDIMEVIWYKRPLTSNEQSRVNSYLAIKNGSTLSENYLNSSSNIVWDRITNDGYNNNIFGLARDNASTLHQKQAASTTINQKLVIGHGSALFESNSDNTNDLTEGQFLMTGDNGLTQNLSIPLVYTSGTNGETNFRFESVWKVQNTNNVGTVMVAWPKGINNLYLVQSSDETFATGNTFTPMTAEVTINGVDYNTTTASLADGQFFTLAGYLYAPGGVASAAWYRADATTTLFSDAGTTLAVDNAAIQQWNEFNNKPFPLSQSNATLRPEFSNATTLVNFNPTVNYTANNKWLQYDGNTQGNVIDRSKGALFSAGNTTGTTAFFGFGVSGSTNTIDDPGLYNFTGNKFLFYPVIGEYDAQSTYTINGPYIGGGTWENGAGTSGTNAVNITLNGFHQTYNTGINNVNLATNRNALMSGGAETSVAFQQNEMIVFANKLTDTEVNKIESYLAIKYGQTLSKEQNRNYLNSAGTVVWDGTDVDYYNNVFGIARDNTSALHQKQSKSVNANQKLIIGNGSSLSNTNAGNTNALTDGQFLIVGDNGLAQGLKVPLIYTSGTNGETNYRFEAIWKVQNTGSVGQVIVAWPKGVKNMYVVQSGDVGFDSTDTFTPMTTEVPINGVIYNTATVTLGNGEFFTFAGYGQAPAGVSNSLSYWYRADANATNTGAGTDVTSWTDVWSGTTVASIGPGPNELPKYAAGAVDYFNFNPGINFTSNLQSLGNMSVQTLTALNYDIFTFAKEGMTGTRFLSIGRNNTPTGSSTWDSPGFHANGSIVRRRASDGNDITFRNPTPALNTNIPNIGYNHFTDTDHYRGVNGSLNANTLTHTAKGLSLGGHIFGNNRNGTSASSSVLPGDDDAGFVGHVGETIIYGSGNLTTEERRRVDSYLAIKYGITLGRADTEHYLGSTASSTSIVWDGTQDAAYNTNIFGIARSDIGSFEQKVSKSVNAGTILTIAKDNDFVLPNNDASRTGLPVDEGYLLLGDNNITTATAVAAPAIGDCGEDLGNGSEFRTIQRKWLVQRTNNIGTTYLQANLAAYSGGINSEIKMLVADDANFTQNVKAIPGTNDGNVWTFAHNFDNENAVRYITFGGTFVTAPCEQCKGGTYTLRTGYQWNQGLWGNQTSNQKLNIALGNDADGNPLTANMYADYSEDPSIEYVPTRYPQQYGGRWTIARRYDNTNAKDRHRIELSQAMKASFQISNINTYLDNKNNFEVIGYCNGAAVMPTITYAYNTSYHTFEINGNQATGTMSWRGFIPNVSTANVRFDRPVDEIVIISSVERVNTHKTLRSSLYGDITLECAEILEPTPDNVYVSHSFTQDTLATCGGETTMRIKVTNNNLCEDKTIDLHQLLPSGLEYVAGSFNGNDLPAGAMDNATVTYSAGSFELSGLTLPRGEHWMYVDIANPGTAGTHPTQFTFEVTDGVDPAFTYSSSVVNLNYYESTGSTPAAPSLELSIKDNVSCGENDDEITYRMKINNPNTGGVTGAEILHMFDYDQTIQSVVFVSGEDEDGVITGDYPLDGSGNAITPVGSSLFNMIDAVIPEGVSYIDITVNVGNSYDIAEVQALGISSSFMVGLGNGECAETGESISNQVTLRMCSVCVKPGATGTPLTSSTGILTKGETSVTNWPESVPNGYLVLDGAFKGMVITHMTTAQIDALTPVEGMLVFDTDEGCVKLYRGAGANAPVVHPSRQGWVCIERVCID